MDADFWDYLDRLVAACPVVIDRPKGSHHPRYPDYVYSLDYGYLEDSTTVDGGGIDVYVGSRPERELDAVMLTVDLYKQDAEIKLMLGCTEAEKQTALESSNEYSMRALLVQRAEDPLAGLQARISVRRFARQPVPQPLIEQILTAATWAPSAHHRQPWRFVILESPQTRVMLADAMGEDFRRDLQADGLPPEEVEVQVRRAQQRLVEAPAAILICLDTRLGDHYPDPRRQQAEYLMGVQGVAMAGENLLLAASALGLSGVWVCAPLFAQATVRQALNLPPTWDAQGFVLLGYAAKPPVPRSRQPLADMVLVR